MIRVPRYQISLVRDGSVPYGDSRVNCSRDLLPIVAPFFEGTDRESLLVVTLDSKNRPIGVNVVSVGTLTESLLHPREVFQTAVLQNAQSVILCHNHPGGDPSPSRADFAATKRIKNAGEVIGIKLLDHVIVGDGGKHFSFSESGELDIMEGFYK